MQVLFDHQVYTNQKYGGISRYFYELSKNLPERGIGVKNSICFSDNAFTTDRQLYNARQLSSFNFKGRGKLKRFLNRKISERDIRKNNFDVFHPTYYDTYFVDKAILKKPFVFTFHDLTYEKFHEKYPEQLTGIAKVISERKTLLKHCAKVIAVSHSTKKDIIEFYRIDPQRIDVIHLASSMNGSGLQKNAALGKYVLYVGNRDGYKNFDLFAQAIAPLLRQDRELKIVAAGGGAFSDTETSAFQALGIQDQVVHKQISDAILAELYYNALCFVFPSLYEGFGIPVLEAFSCHCPALLSNVSSLPEVGGNAAEYFDPENEDDIREKIAAVISSEHLRNELVTKGLQQCAKFSWQMMADQTVEVYRSVV